MIRTAPTFQVRFDLARVPQLAARYDIPYDAVMESSISPTVRSQGFYTREQFLTACAWKTPRSKPRCAENDEPTIQEATRFALSTPVERLRIEVPTLLRGVSWPTASVLLHWGHRDRYPILDVRALESLGEKEPATGYSFEFWWDYVACCRNLADQARVDMRTLDRALWQYSKENQDERR